MEWAAARLVDELTKVALGRYAIAVVGDEPRLAYNRVLLSSVLAGETASHDIELKPFAWWREPRCHLEIWLPRHRDRRGPPRTQDRK
jgi:NAD(P)H-nitrite reductase large subunit